MSWTCGTCEIVMSSSSRSKHLRSSRHADRLNGDTSSICDICKVKITHRNDARHNRSHGHLAALARAEEERKKEALTRALALAEEQRNKEALVPVVTTEEKNETDLTLDEFIVADCARYVEWIQENPQHARVYRNPRSVVYTVIYNLYATLSCKNPTCPWWPESFTVPANATAWREDILHRSIGDVAMADSILIVAGSGLTFESR